MESLEERRLLAALPMASPPLAVAAAVGQQTATVTIGAGAVAAPGATVNVPITINNGSTLQAIDLVIRYDTARLNIAVADISFGELLAGWSLTPAVNDAAGTIVISSFTTTPLQVSAGTLFNLAFHVDPNATSGTAGVDLPAAFNTFALNEGTIGMSVIPGGVAINAAGPTVTQVLLSSSSWTADFKSYLISHNIGTADGATVPIGANQTKPLPWAGLNRISLAFGEHAQVTKQDLQVFGLNANYSVIDFSYQPSTHVATWTLDKPVDVDRLLLRLSDSVHDNFGKNLDGEWTTNQPQGPSGNGVPGGVFLFQVNVLPGDASGDGVVDIADYTLWADRFAPFGPLASAAADFTGNGVIDIGDYTVWADHFLVSLPPGTPTPPAMSAGVFDTSATREVKSFTPVALSEDTSMTGAIAPLLVNEQSQPKAHAKQTRTESADSDLEARCQAAWTMLVDQLANEEAIWSGPRGVDEEEHRILSHALQAALSRVRNR